MADPEGVADSVAGIVASFSRDAGTPAVSERTTGGIRPRIVEFVRRRTPVEGQMLWSPKKHWVRGADGAVDLAELAALQTLLSIDAAVRAVYPAGVAFRLDVEDIEFEFMERQDAEVVAARETYVSGLKRLIAALQLDEAFTLRRTSEHAKSEEELRCWRRQMVENHRALEAYWYESEGRTVAAQEALPSFKELRRLGWKGTIPAEMRRYYLNRLGRLADAPDRARVDMVLRNLAGILLHYQIGLLRGSGAAHPVKFSFVRPADSAPAELLVGRVDLRFAPRTLCSRVGAAAPWATKGFVCGRGDRMLVSFRGWHELVDARCRFAEGWLALAGPEDPAEVRVDLLCEEADKGKSVEL
ncbi:MAG: hypothetical protein EHM71_09020 [Zetaproteobacteria bacterium]|nr:MAG: hypothetical protein EHM71_09020 [Zetaproteobacteria bacterium]